MGIVDPQVTPYSSREDIEAAIKDVQKLPDSPERSAALEMLQQYLQLKNGPSVAS